MKIDNQGSIILFSPQGDEEYNWLVECVDSEPYQWLGNSLAVDHRMAGALIDEINDIGFAIEEI